MISEVHNEDCMIGMKRFPDKFFELAIVDPEYGINASKGTWGSSNCGKVTDYGKKDWDKKPVSQSTLLEIIRVSKNQVIWGANHFISQIPFDSSCWIVWDKENSGDFADCELAWTSFETAVRKFKYRWNGMLQQDMKNKEKRIHPTQKPVALYKWLLTNYAKPATRFLILTSAAVVRGLRPTIWALTSTGGNLIKITTRRRRNGLSSSNRRRRCLATSN